MPTCRTYSDLMWVSVCRGGCTYFGNSSQKSLPSTAVCKACGIVMFYVPSDVRMSFACVWHLEYFLVSCRAMLIPDPSSLKFFTYMRCILAAYPCRNGTTTSFEKLLDKAAGKAYGDSLPGITPCFRYTLIVKKGRT